ncbi:MAG: peptidoglycan-associated lipoprotein Pal [Rickettsiales bacterium]|nr:peptidoglycan-associated lipoprotein Pal [Rickettsiales bacterium]
MRSLKTILAAAAALTLLAACETAPTEGGVTDGASGYDSGSGEFTMGNSDGSITPGTQADLEANVGDRVLFGTNSSTVDGEAQATLERQASWLRKYSDVNVIIEGHADERGTREYNLALGERRANSAKNYIVGLGISPTRVSTISYGKERPSVLGHSGSSWAQNRRAVTVVAN